MLQKYLNMISFHELSWQTGAILVGLALFSYIFAQVILTRLIKKVVFRKHKEWQKVFDKLGTLKPLSYVLPLFFLQIGLAHVKLVPLFVESVLKASMTWSIALLIRRLLLSFQAIYDTYPLSNRHPVTGYVQLVMLFLYFITGVVVICDLFNKSPAVFLSGLGAATALLMLVFRDTILSFIAGLQIAGNNLLEKGDWIELPSYGANGSVIDVTLNVVKIENFDKSLVVVPTYKLLDVGFKSWRNMQDVGRRRVKRELSIDQHDFKEFNAEELKAIHANKDLMQYLPKDTKETNNVGLFRSYVAGYLGKHAKVYQDYPPIIRLKAPGIVGMPLELIYFVSDTRWRHFEETQSDIVQHLIARLRDFGLKSGQEC